MAQKIFFGKYKFLDRVISLYQTGDKDTLNNLVPIIVQNGESTNPNFEKYFSLRKTPGYYNYYSLVFQGNPQDHTKAQTIYWNEQLEGPFTFYTEPAEYPAGLTNPPLFPLSVCYYGTTKKDSCIAYTGFSSMPNNQLLFTVKTPNIEAIKKAKGCPHGDFSGVDLTGQDLSGLDFTNADFTDAILKNTNFTNAVLKDTIFKNNIFTGTNFTNVDLSGKDFSNHDLTKTIFDKATFDSQTKFLGALVHGTIFSNTDLTKAQFDKTPNFSYSKDLPMIFTGSKIPYSLINNNNWNYFSLDGEVTILDLPLNLSSITKKLSAIGTNLNGFNFYKFTLSYANFTDAMLQGANLENTILDSVTFKGAQLDSLNIGTKTTNTSLQNAFLQNVQLDMAHLRNAFMNNAQFYGSYNYANGIDLTNVNLSHANLVQIDISGSSSADAARLENVKLDGANLIKAKLNYANISGNASLNGAFLQNTDFSNVDLRGANLSASSVCLSDDDATVLGVPLFTIKTDIKGFLNKGDIAGAQLEEKFKSGGQRWPQLGLTPTLVTSVLNERWLLTADSEVLKKIQASTMTGLPSYISYYLVFKEQLIFVFGCDLAYESEYLTSGKLATIQKILFVKSKEHPDGLDITKFPEKLPDSMYCPNGETVKQNTIKNVSMWYQMLGPTPPSPAKCIPDPIHHHYCPPPTTVEKIE